MMSLYFDFQRTTKKHTEPVMIYRNECFSFPSSDENKKIKEIISLIFCDKFWTDYQVVLCYVFIIMMCVFCLKFFKFRSFLVVRFFPLFSNKLFEFQF